MAEETQDQAQPKEDTEVKAPETPQEQPEIPQPEAPQGVTKSIQPPQVQLNVDPQTALNITVQEFDKKISEAKAVVAELEKQKAAYIYDTNIQILLAAAQQQQQQEGQ